MTESQNETMGPIGLGPTGIGLGFRVEFAESFLGQSGAASFVEVHPENYIRRGGLFASNLERVASSLPIFAHGLSLGLGNPNGFDSNYLKELRTFLDSIGAPFYSDHLAITEVDGIFVHDLLPVPYRKEAMSHCIDRIHQLQDALDLPIAFENVSSYARFAAGEGAENDFVLELLDRADCGILFDVNNVVVNQHNHGLDAHAFVDSIPRERIYQVHIAGHLVRHDGIRVDTHAENVGEEAQALLTRLIARTGALPVLLERDGNYPSYEDLLLEMSKVRAAYDRGMDAFAAKGMR